MELPGVLTLRFYPSEIDLTIFAVHSVSLSPYYSSMGKHQSPVAETPKRQFVDEKVLAAVSGRSVRQLQKDRLLKSGIFPHFKIGRSIKYDLPECLEIIEKTRVEPRKGTGA